MGIGKGGKDEVVQGGMEEGMGSDTVVPQQATDVSTQAALQVANDEATYTRISQQDFFKLYKHLRQQGHNITVVQFLIILAALTVGVTSTVQYFYSAPGAAKEKVVVGTEELPELLNTILYTAAATVFTNLPLNTLPIIKFLEHVISNVELIKEIPFLGNQNFQRELKAVYRRYTDSGAHGLARFTQVASNLTHEAALFGYGMFGFYWAVELGLNNGMNPAFSPFIFLSGGALVRGGAGLVIDGIGNQLKSAGRYLHGLGEYYLGLNALAPESPMSVSLKLLKAQRLATIKQAEYEFYRAVRSPRVALEQGQNELNLLNQLICDQNDAHQVYSVKDEVDSLIQSLVAVGQLASSTKSVNIEPRVEDTSIRARWTASILSALTTASIPFIGGYAYFTCKLIGVVKGSVSFLPFLLTLKKYAPVFAASNGAMAVHPLETRDHASLALKHHAYIVGFTMLLGFVGAYVSTASLDMTNTKARLDAMEHLYNITAEAPTEMTGYSSSDLAAYAMVWASGMLYNMLNTTAAAITIKVGADWLTSFFNFVCTPEAIQVIFSYFAMLRWASAENKYEYRLEGFLRKLRETLETANPASFVAELKAVRDYARTLQPVEANKFLTDYFGGKPYAELFPNTSTAQQLEYNARPKVTPPAPLSYEEGIDQLEVWFDAEEHPITEDETAQDLPVANNADEAETDLEQQAPAPARRWFDCCKGIGLFGRSNSGYQALMTDPVPSDEEDAGLVDARDMPPVTPGLAARFGATPQ